MSFKDIDIGRPGGTSAKVTRSGDIKTATGEDATEQWVERCVLANPGALVHRPQFGAGVERYIGAPRPAAQQQCATAIRQALLTRPGFQRVKVTATSLPSTSTETLSLEVDITTTSGARRSITVSV